MSLPLSAAAIKPLILHPSHMAALTPETFHDASTGGNVSWKTLMSNDRTATNTFTVGIASCPPGRMAACPACPPSPTSLASPPSPPSPSSPSLTSTGHLKPHRHSHAEIYHVTAGRGIVSIDGVEHAVQKGSVVFIPGDAEHGIRNGEADEDLVWLYVFAADGFGEIVYRFSGEEGVRAKL
ncbi:RmlC-like cupin [Stemphylium lycopersici]|uniref:RmlC-like cupin n=1 Tax=Stemphylium lycopersici TaxID=183478 RepID=A0A364NAI6_STELY|nr:hypothetical protein TW65_00067 [Stemphylium lycopersici]RAR09540.1 RmlC-like cupin [Stemphylium lycopersici]RAR14250.1 RmlC-like cupin [Stemphylium lycopersici]